MWPRGMLGLSASQAARQAAVPSELGTISNGSSGSTDVTNAPHLGTMLCWKFSIKLLGVT